VLGGGIISNSDSVAVNINSTFPQNNGWRADLNNNTTPDTTFDVQAVCGKKPRGYAIVTGPQVLNPAFTQTLATATCPDGTVKLSGGDLSFSFSPAVDLGSASGTATGWETFENNGQFFDTTVEALAVCAA
jgi:hypothetical protein